MFMPYLLLGTHLPIYQPVEEKDCVCNKTLIDLRNNREFQYYFCGHVSYLMYINSLRIELQSTACLWER